jgi:hypothetical protein
MVNGPGIPRREAPVDEDGLAVQCIVVGANTSHSVRTRQFDSDALIRSPSPDEYLHSATGADDMPGLEQGNSSALSSSPSSFSTSASSSTSAAFAHRSPHKSSSMKKTLPFLKGQSN